jgi:hypothetical protein
MSRFASHFLMLMLGLIAGVVLAVSGFSPHETPDRSVRALRDRRMPQIERTVEAPVDRVEAPPAPVKPLAAERTPLIQESRAPRRTDGPATLWIQLHLQPEDEGAPLVTVLARVRSFKDSDPDAIARSTAPLDHWTTSANPVVTYASPENSPEKVQRGTQPFFQGLAAGSYRLVIALHGRRVDDREVELKAGEDRRVDVALPALAPESRLIVRVKDESGAAVTNASFGLGVSMKFENSSRSVGSRIDFHRRGEGSFLLFLPEFAANRRAGRVGADCAIQVWADGFERNDVPVPSASTGEIDVTLRRRDLGALQVLHVHVIPARSGREPAFGDVSLLGPTDGPRQVGQSMRTDADGVATFTGLVPGHYEGWVMSAGSECEVPNATLHFESEVTAGDASLDLSLPPLHRVTVVTPPEFAAAIPRLGDPDRDLARDVEFGDGSNETDFSFVTEGLHDVRIGPHRMRIDVRADLRVDFVPDPALEIPATEKDGRR